MTAQSLLSQLREKGVQLKVSGADRLVIDAPKGALTSELRSALADHKTEILKTLQSQQQDDQEITEVAPPAVAPTEPAPAEESAPAAATAVADTADEELMPSSSIAEEVKRLEVELLRLRAEEETRRPPSIRFVSSRNANAKLKRKLRDSEPRKNDSGLKPKSASAPTRSIDEESRKSSWSARKKS